jgi:hypothetical protein
MLVSHCEEAETLQNDQLMSERRVLGLQAGSST